MYGLKSEDVVVCDETLTVFQASNEMDLNRSMLISQADDTWNGREADDTRGRYLKYVTTLLYPSLVACTQGNVPTLEQFQNDIPVEESDRWIAVAQKLNPRWFQFTQPEVSDEKKD